MAYHLGVDQGTTYTAAAIAREGRAEMMSLGSRAADVPSVVFLKQDETILVGEAASRRGQSEPSRVAREFKRRFGDPTPLMLGGTPISADIVWAKLLGWILKSVTEAQGGPPSGVTVTHPANWGPYKLDLLAQAIRLAELPNPSILSEPEAAAISYATSNRVGVGEVVAVYDLGGGTFDAAVLRRTSDGFDLLGKPDGIERLGGIDVDEAVFAHVTSNLGDVLETLDPEDAAVRSAVARLRQECIVAKEALSSDSDVTIPVLLPSVSTEVRLTRAELEAMIRPTLGPTIDALRRTIDSAGLTLEQVSAILLVGGSSRIPLVGQMVGASLGRPVVIDAHPKHSVALGAALFAADAPAIPIETTKKTAAPAIAVTPPVKTPEPAPVTGPKSAPPKTPAAPLVVAAVEEAESSAEPQPPRSAGAPPGKAPKQPDKKPAKTWMLGLVAVLAIGAFFAFRASGDRDSGNLTPVIVPSPTPPEEPDEPSPPPPINPSAALLTVADLEKLGLTSQIVEFKFGSACSMPHATLIDPAPDEARRFQIRDDFLINSVIRIFDNREQAAAAIAQVKQCFENNPGVGFETLPINTFGEEMAAAGNGHFEIVDMRIGNVVAEIHISRLFARPKSDTNLLNSLAEIAATRAKIVEG